MKDRISATVWVDANTLLSAQHFAKWLNLKGQSEFDLLLNLNFRAQELPRPLLVRLASVARSSTLGEADNDYFGDRQLIPLAENLERLSVMPK